MKRLRIVGAVLLATVAGGLLRTQPAWGQERVSPGKIVLEFTAKEKEFAQAFSHYTYTQNVSFQILRDDGSVREERRMVSEVFFNEKGERETKVVSDEGGLTSVTITENDIDNVLNLQPFVLTRDDLEYYKIAYQGREKVDELNTYVFDVRPRRMDPGKRYFDGRIWVDDVDLQVVMTRGKPVPEPGEEKFPRFETVRQQIDGKYWFPVWSLADDYLEFRNQTVHIRVLATWEDFQEYQVSTKVTFGDVVKDDGSKEKPPR
ncbi:MAG TPA: hypothetical protein VLU25_01815 [Acidobacteriota bacterium]|nr:hypothetical protein [Acidobacteriota bacterium]